MLLPFVNLVKYAIKTSNITQVTFHTNVMRYLSNEVTVTTHNFITKLLNLLLLQ